MTFFRCWQQYKLHMQTVIGATRRWISQAVERRRFAQLESWNTPRCWRSSILKSMKTSRLKQNCKMQYRKSKNSKRGWNQLSRRSSRMVFFFNFILFIILVPTRWRSDLPYFWIYEFFDAFSNGFGRIFKLQYDLIVFLVVSVKWIYNIILIYYTYIILWFLHALYKCVVPGKGAHLDRCLYIYIYIL